MTEQSAWKNFVAGGAGGVCLIVSGHPFDTIKVRLQTLPVPLPGQAPLYRGSLDCLLKTIRTEGAKGFFKGMGVPFVVSTPVFALSFYGFGLGKDIVRAVTGDETENLSCGKLFVAGGISGILTTVVTAPSERIKCLLQIQASAKDKVYNGPIDCAKKLYMTGGLRSISRGTVLTLYRDVPGSGMYFAGYEWIKQFLTPAGADPSKLSIGSILVAGGVAGMLGWAVAIPSDILKSRLQTAREGRYSGTTDVFRDVMKNEGISGMFRGFTPVMLRAFPSNACCFMGYEVALQLLNGFFPPL